MHLPAFALVTMAAIGTQKASFEDPRYQCYSDAILVCCEEFNGSVIGAFTGIGTSCESSTRDRELYIHTR